MKQLFLSFLMLTITAIFAQKKDYTIHAIQFNEVKLTDNFRLPRLRINHTVTIPASFERSEKNGRVTNFLMAAERSGKFCII